MSQVPVVQGVACVLAHVPGLVPLGSKPSRELAKDPALGEAVRGHLRDYRDAVAYGPNQAFIGNLRPQALFDAPQPWWQHPLAEAPRTGPFGEVLPEEEFWGLLKLADDFDLLHLDAAVAAGAAERLRRHPLLGDMDLAKLAGGVAPGAVAAGAAAPGHLALADARGRCVGYAVPGHEEDISQTPHILLENLAAKATGALALRHLLRQTGTAPDRIDYLLGCGEEAVGDRYQRGGGNLAKAMAELAGLPNAGGADVKAFCCAPVHALVLGGALIAAGVQEHAVVVGGGSLAKLGMKFRGALAHDMPILEDCLAAVAIQLGPDDGAGDPRLRLDVVGKHNVAIGGAPRPLYEALVLRPLQRAGLAIPDVDRYAVELHNGEIMEAGGSGNVARTNYRTIASLAVVSGQLPRDRVDAFEREHGMPGYAPTQGHIPAAVPYLAHAREEMRAGAIRRALFVAKGSLFLGKMTNLADGMSVLVEAAS
ncbi:MAG TPA: glycine/sarcosine/betaine reductase complex component C subunit beta [Chloroflexota bacterium]|nr:glycine/sarcosine/betaine reductase complex component C subunit beta [Chloroflexota bacterium]